MKKFNPHNLSLINFFESLAGSAANEEVQKYIDLDSADGVLRSFLTIEEMREIGSFFTGQKLASAAVDSFKTKITDNSVVLDPSCGTGNLLLECSKSLSIKETLSQTLKSWGLSLWGFDIHRTFADTTQLRLILAAINRGAEQDCTIEEAIGYLKNIKVFDAMAARVDDLADLTHVIMNPPFSNWQSPQVNYWAKGKINAAGIILDHYVRNLPDDCEISAILPDVLRSGTRYEKMRSYVNHKVDGLISIYGRFNAKTDVDVFILSGRLTTSRSNISWYEDCTKGGTLGDFFEVLVGPVVPHRDADVGPKVPFIHSRNTIPWQLNDRFTEFRGYKGRLIQPPFVTIRRTSSPSDRSRAIAAVVGGNGPVAVENHLIVAKPKNGQLLSCVWLMEALQSPAINNHLNDRIRCRHLTVGVVKNIPISEP